MVKNRIKIESKDSDGNPVVVYVVRPNKDNNAQAQIVASKTFRDAILRGALVRKTLEDLLIKQGIWDAERQAKVDKIDEDIRSKLLQLKKGGIKLAEARDTAIGIRIARMNRASLLSEKNAHDEFTAESQSENSKFDYLVSVCIKDEDGNNVFKDIDDYKEKSGEPYASEAAAKLATLVWGLDDDWEHNLPENKFLKKFDFVDNDLRLVNKEGKYVTKDGKLIDKDGLPIVDFTPFLDDDGNPIVEQNEESKVEDVSS